MDQNQGILQALMGNRPSMPGWANPEIQRSGVGQLPRPIGQLPFGQMPQQAQIPGMLGGQPPMMNRPTGITPPVLGGAQPQPMVPGMSPFGAAQPKMA